MTWYSKYQKKKNLLAFQLTVSIFTSTQNTWVFLGPTRNVLWDAIVIVSRVRYGQLCHIWLSNKPITKRLWGKQAPCTAFCFQWRSAGRCRPLWCRSKGPVGGIGRGLLLAIYGLKKCKCLPCSWKMPTTDSCVCLSWSPVYFYSLSTKDILWPI